MLGLYHPQTPLLPYTLPNTMVYRTNSTALELLRTVFEVRALPGFAQPTRCVLKKKTRGYLQSILQVFLICFAGWVVAKQGILDKKTQKQINRLNVSLFTPALLFSKVAFFLTPDKLRELWIIPIIFVAVTSVSGIVAWIFARLWRLKRSQRAFAIAASMFMNSNSLPIALMQSLVVTVHGLRWGPHDTHNAMLGRALTYLVLYSTLGLMLRWSYGVQLLAQADDEVIPDEPEETLSVPSSPSGDEGAPLLGHDFSDTPRKNYSSATLRSEGPAPSIMFTNVTDEDDQGEVRPTSTSPLHPREQTHGETSEGELLSPRLVRRKTNPQSHFFYSFPNTPHMSGTSLPPESASDIAPTETDNGVWEKFKTITRKCNEFMTPPMWAALASLLVACVRPIQHALETHVSPVKGALSSAGNCSIPLTLIVLGGYFYAGKESAAKPNLPQVRPQLPEEDVEDQQEGHVNRRLERPQSDATLVGTWSRRLKNKIIKASPTTVAKIGGARKGETATVFVAVMSRMIITPLALMPACALVAKYATHAVFDDPVFVVSNVLLISSPPALTLAQITQAASGDAFERLLSRTIFWSYCILTPITTILYVVLGLWLARL